MPFFIKGKGDESNLYLNVEGNRLVMSENKFLLLAEVFFGENNINSCKIA